MARDFDFKRSTNQRPTPSVAKPAPVQPGATPPANTPSKIVRAKSLSWIWVAIGLVVVAIATYFYIQSAQPVVLQTTPSATVSSSSTKAATPPTQESALVNVYNGGAGKDAVDAFVAKLNQNQLTAVNAGDTQFQYDKTYVWYLNQYSGQAAQVATLLNDPHAISKESQTSGVFKIIVYLAK